MKRTILKLLLPLMIVGPCLAQQEADEMINGLPTVKAEETDTSVNIDLYEDQELPVIGRGIAVFIEGWEPNDEITPYAIGPDGNKVSLLKENLTLSVPDDGSFRFDLPYTHQNLYTGKWMLVIEGKSGVHGHYFHVPEDPDAGAAKQQ